MPCWRQPEVILFADHNHLKSNGVFVIDEILPGLFRIRIPLPNSPLKELNSYVIKSGDRSLVIDTGFNRDACFDAMVCGLRELGLEPSGTDFMLTHMHSDHTGLISRLAHENSKVYFGRIDARVFDGGIDWRPIMAYAILNGFDEAELKAALTEHPGIKYKPVSVPEFTLQDDGDIIGVGDWRLRCLLTPGHTAGHICLFEETRGVLFSGDHVLYDITPHIESWLYDVNSLKDYLDSLDRVRDLPVNLVLPGHRSSFTDLSGRVDELKRHHERRANEALEVLGDSAMSAWDIAARMTWKIRCDGWDRFPIAQKWFAVGETIAHLRWLEGEGRVCRDATGKVAVFRAC